MSTTSSSSSSSSSSEQDPLRDAVVKEFTEAGYTNEEIQTVLTQQDALRRIKDDDADSILDAYHLPWQLDEADEEYILIKKEVSTELLDEIFEHTRRAQEDSYNIRSSNPSGGRYGWPSSRRTPHASYSPRAGHVQRASYTKLSNMRRTELAVYDNAYGYGGHAVPIDRPSRSAARMDRIYTA
ncbi:predicted protein [Aspergillus nidulans FGSC A4]|uniref:Uncharacterized protein n=1 Tax=Emericella nidulans (strain FGSC A4 / ATCC 38163 / CBS 112.46 / NRRL 194 / M139) TaxID=227321 RepID=Q5AZ02_EMENI|nr:hypothetical protein [Aspergillus nidulans FGSC A4]EAA58500.1 predicted protein [Aspergillus nidulans FGSC A4]CBF69375.1 TPA: conserved hypothetical protein [Aspergillus nidulans FGSC A4]|eukprot:XP_664082.1 predicted protein [Aspergillus nidulans FGSC A4]